MIIYVIYNLTHVFTAAKKIQVSKSFSVYITLPYQKTLENPSIFLPESNFQCSQ